MTRNNLKTHKKKIRDLMMIKISEETIHNHIAQYLNTVIKKPSRWLTIETSNQQGGKLAAIRQARQRRKGVPTGWPDIMIIWVCPIITRLIFLEVKTKVGRLTPNQIKIHEELKQEGHRVNVVRSIDDVSAILKDVGII